MDSVLVWSDWAVLRNFLAVTRAKSVCYKGEWYGNKLKLITRAPKPGYEDMLRTRVLG